MFDKIKTKLLFIPSKELGSIAQSHYRISNDVKAKCRSHSRKFRGKMTWFPSAFAQPMKIRARSFLLGKPIKNILHFCYVLFLRYFLRSYESPSISVLTDLIIFLYP